MDWTGLNVLVTGGTGSFGQKFTEIMLREFRPRKLVIFSRELIEAARDAHRGGLTSQFALFHRGCEGCGQIAPRHDRNGYRGAYRCAETGSRM